MFKKIDKYILSESLLPFISGSGIITGVWLGIDKFKTVFKLLAQSGAGIDKGFIILGLEIPQIIAMTTPVAILLASFLTFQKLAGQSEILAMRAAGVSYLRLMRPVLYLGIVGLLIGFTLQEAVVPVASPLAKKMYSYALYGNPVPKEKLKSFSYFEKDAQGTIKRIFYAKGIKEGVLKQIVILDLTQRKISQIFTAREALWSPEKGGWLLKNGSSHYIQADDKTAETDELSLVSSFTSTFIPSSINPHKILEKTKSFREMNIAQLGSFIGDHIKGNYVSDDLKKAQSFFHNRFAYPVSCLFLALVGASLGITGRRTVINWGYISLGLVVFIFYMSQAMFESLGSSGAVAPFMAAWIPNLVLAMLAGLAVWYRAEN